MILPLCDFGISLLWKLNIAAGTRSASASINVEINTYFISIAMWIHCETRITRPLYFAAIRTC